MRKLTYMNGEELGTWQETVVAYFRRSPVQTEENNEKFQSG
jgi:hypothetical protein